MLYFSLSYLQLENRVLPPIGTTSRATKLSSLSGIQYAVADIKTFNDGMTSNTTASQHIESSKAVNNVMDLHAKSGNESNANIYLHFWCAKGDNSIEYLQ